MRRSILPLVLILGAGILTLNFTTTWNEREDVSCHVTGSNVPCSVFDGPRGDLMVVNHEYGQIYLVSRDRWRVGYAVEGFWSIGRWGWTFGEIKNVSSIKVDVKGGSHLVMTREGLSFAGRDGRDARIVWKDL